MDTHKLFARAKAILLTPRTEWPIIAAEPDTIAEIFRNYVVVLAGIAAICRFLSMSVVGARLAFLGGFRVPFGTGLAFALFSYALGLLGVYVVALIVEGLAPTFGGTKDRLQALKVVAYSFTAGWVAAIVGLVPGIGGLARLAGILYGIYLLYLGLPATMKCPPDKAGGYTAVALIVAIIVMFMVEAVVGTTLGLGMAGFGSL